MLKFLFKIKTKEVNMFGRKHPYHYQPRNHYPYPTNKSSSGIFFLLIVLVGVYFLQIKGYIPGPEIVPFWFLALAVIAVFFLFKRKEHY